MAQRFDRAQEDSGNSVQLEHLNLRQPDQRLVALGHSRPEEVDPECAPTAGFDRDWKDLFGGLGPGGEQHAVPRLRAGEDLDCRQRQ